MRRMPVLGPRCHTDEVMQGGKTTVHIWNTTRPGTHSPGPSAGGGARRGPRVGGLLTAVDVPWGKETR